MLAKNGCRQMNEGLPDYTDLEDYLNVSCNCMTKTPDPRYHSHICPVWLYHQDIQPGDHVYIIPLLKDEQNQRGVVQEVKGHRAWVTNMNMPYMGTVSAWIPFYDLKKG